MFGVYLRVKRNFEKNKGFKRLTDWLHFHKLYNRLFGFYIKYGGFNVTIKACLDTFSLFVLPGWIYQSGKDCKSYSNYHWGVGFLRCVFSHYQTIAPHFVKNRAQYTKQHKSIHNTDPDCKDIFLYQRLTRPNPSPQFYVTSHKAVSFQDLFSNDNHPILGPQSYSFWKAWFTFLFLWHYL